MRKLRTLFILGIWTALLPYLGFPLVIKKILFLITGLFVSFIAYLFYIEKRASHIQSKSSAQPPSLSGIPSSYEHSQQFHPQMPRLPHDIHGVSPVKVVEQSPVRVQKMEVQQHPIHPSKHKIVSPSLSPIQVPTLEIAAKRKVIHRKKKSTKETLKIGGEFTEKTRIPVDISS